MHIDIYPNGEAKVSSVNAEHQCYNAYSDMIKCFQEKKLCTPFIENWDECIRNDENMSANKHRKTTAKKIK